MTQENLHNKYYSHSLQVVEDEDAVAFGVHFAHRDALVVAADASDVTVKDAHANETHVNAYNRNINVNIGTGASRNFKCGCDFHPRISSTTSS